MQNSPPLEDRLAIQDLMAQYAWSLDTGDIDGFVTCFTADGVAIEDVFEEADRWAGAVQIRRMVEHYSRSPGFPGRQHHSSQIRIQGDAEHATSQSFVFVTECRGEPPYTLRFAGYYEDVLVKQDGRWKFAERTIRLWDGPVLHRLPGKGEKVARKRPPELVVRPGA